MHRRSKSLSLLHAFSAFGLFGTLDSLGSEPRKPFTAKHLMQTVNPKYLTPELLKSHHQHPKSPHTDSQTMVLLAQIPSLTPASLAQESFISGLLAWSQLEGLGVRPLPSKPGTFSATCKMPNLNQAYTLNPKPKILKP